MLNEQRQTGQNDHSKADSNHLKINIPNKNHLLLLLKSLHLQEAMLPFLQVHSLPLCILRSASDNRESLKALRCLVAINLLQHDFELGMQFLLHFALPTVK